MFAGYRVLHPGLSTNPAQLLLGLWHQVVPTVDAGATADAVADEPIPLEGRPACERGLFEQSYEYDGRIGAPIDSRTAAAHVPMSPPAGRGGRPNCASCACVAVVGSNPEGTERLAGQAVCTFVGASPCGQDGFTSGTPDALTVAPTAPLVVPNRVKAAATAHDVSPALLPRITIPFFATARRGSVAFRTDLVNSTLVTRCRRDRRGTLQEHMSADTRQALQT